MATGAFCALTNLPQLHKESTTCKLCHIDAVTVQSLLVVLVVEDITRAILVGSELKMVKGKLPLVDLPSSTAITRVDAPKITLPTEKQNGIPNGIKGNSVSVQDTL